MKFGPNKNRKQLRKSHPGLDPATRRRVGRARKNEAEVSRIQPKPAQSRYS